MAAKTDDDSSFMDKVIERFKGSGKGGPNQVDPTQNKVRFSIWYFVAAMLAFAWFQSYTGSQQIEKISYSDFKQWAREGKVEKLVVAPEQITGKLKGEEGKPARQFVTVRIEDPELVGQLEQKGIKFSGYVENKWLGVMQDDQARRIFDGYCPKRQKEVLVYELPVLGSVVVGKKLVRCPIEGEYPRVLGKFSEARHLPLHHPAEPIEQHRSFSSAKICCPVSPHLFLFFDLLLEVPVSPAKFRVGSRFLSSGSSA